MAHYAIVTTYPRSGSRNIGDQLITNSIVHGIELVKGKMHRFSVLWRASRWEDVCEAFKSADAIIFAGLAMRPFMHAVEYPILEKILNVGVPYAVVSAGTSLNIGSTSYSLYGGFSEITLRLLRQINQQALFCSSRGFLTQSFCCKNGLSNFVFSGDIAFLDSRYSNRRFESGREIKRIAISDPHFAPVYLTSLEVLCEGCKEVFPKAELVIVQHGVSKVVESFAKKRGLRLQKIYLDKDKGLDFYDRVDLHVGFRVHGHVAALSRRIYSYLLEQDGRGCDYGLTINRKISIPNYCSYRSNLSVISLARALLGKRARTQFVSAAPAAQIVSLIENDFRDGFRKFDGLERQLEEFTERLLVLIERLP